MLSVRNNQAIPFKALTFKPEPQEWNEDVLEAALESRYVQDFMKKSAKQKEDVVMSLTDTIPGGGVIPYGYRILNFRLDSKAQSASIKSVARPAMGKNGVVYKDIYYDEIKDVNKDLAKKIRDLGVVSSGNSQEVKLQNLKNLAEFKVY